MSGLGVRLHDVVMLGVAGVAFLLPPDTADCLPCLGASVTITNPLCAEWRGRKYSYFSLTLLKLVIVEIDSVFTSAITKLLFAFKYQCVKVFPFRGHYSSLPCSTLLMK
jgi:hypothetical protein